MPYVTIDGLRLYYELTGPDDGPLILQLGGSLFGRQNFDLVNDGFREHFRLLSYDASGYGRSDCPIETYTIENWASEARGLLDALDIGRVLVHGTSMGGMIAIAFTATYPERTIATCADCAFARCDLYRQTMFRSWRHSAESMPLDDLADLVTIQGVSPTFIEANPDVFERNRAVIGKNSPFTIRQACFAMETMDLEAMARSICRPILFTNGTSDIMTPPILGQSGFSARQICDAVPEWARLHEFPNIGHADLLEAPGEAVRVVASFFREVLDRDAPANRTRQQ
jgi:pimeloyl-ACP methyl ester carboxylesterase